MEEILIALGCNIRVDNMMWLIQTFKSDKNQMSYKGDEIFYNTYRTML